MHADVGIVTVLTDCELPAILNAFHILPTTKPNNIERGVRYWEVSLMNFNLERSLKIVITAIGEPGNSGASAVTSEIIKVYAPSLVCLVGIAAGVKEKLSLGDIVISKYILGYETEKLLPGDNEGKPNHKEVPFSVRQDVKHFISLINHEELEEKISKQIKSLDSNKLPPADLIPISRKIKEEIVIASGEKIFGDGSLSHLAKMYHDTRVLAGEMEGIGFAVSADRANCSWIVIRGISDYGDPMSKDGRYKDKFHNIASIASAEVLKSFLEKGYSGSQSKLKAGSVNNVLKYAPSFKIKTVLMTMHDKTGIEPLLNYFENQAIKIVATPNTGHFLNGLGFKATSTYEFSKCIPMKLSRGTLHPYILAAIAADPSNEDHINELEQIGIQKIGLVFVNTKDPIMAEEVELGKLLKLLSDVQIGGPSLLRWVIKNWCTCTAVVDPTDYSILLQDLKNNNNELSSEFRIRLLTRSLQYLSYKDSQTAKLLNALWPGTTWG